MNTENSSNTPYLSVVAASRNDDHGGDLDRRTQFFINGLLAQTERHRLPTELVLVEWNPPENRSQLAKILQFPATHPWMTVRIVTVPAAVHARFRHAQALPFYQMIAKNVGIRQARGEFILCTNIDILFADALFAYLATFPLASGSYYRSIRRDTTFLTDDPTLGPNTPLDTVMAACERHLLRINAVDGTSNMRTGEYHTVYPPGATEQQLGRPLLFTNACGDFTLLSRKDYERLRGYAELDMFSFHLDALFLYTAHYAGLQEVVLPESMAHYHIEHSSGWTPEVHKTGTLDKRIDALRIPRLDNDALYALIDRIRLGAMPQSGNGPDWGLSGEHFPEVTLTTATWEKTAALPVMPSLRLSIVVTTRNDDHGGNMAQRFQTFLNHLAQQCDRHGLEVELIVVEWNPDRTRPMLRQCMRWPRAEHLHIRGIIVPPEMHQTLQNADAFPLFQMIAKNVGIRRATAKWILCTNVDILFSDALMVWLTQTELDPKVFYRIDRHDVGSTSIPDGLGTTECLTFCREHVVRVQTQRGTSAQNDKIFSDDPNLLHTNACGDFTLMAKEAWLALRGYPEFHLWSIFIDGLLLHAAKAIGMQQKIIQEPCRIYHIEHGLGWAKEQKTIQCRPSLDYHREYLPLCRKMLAEGKPLDVNGPDWGLANRTLEEWTPDVTEEQPAWPGYAHWIELLAFLNRRLYYRDQSADTLASLEAQARVFDPTVIVELGTLGGMSLRAWIRSAPRARITAIDQSFATLRQSISILPIDLSRVTLLEADILAVEFSRLWGPRDRVLFFVDAHDQPGVPIMRHVCHNAIPALPAGSMVIVDDLWHTPHELTPETAKAFLQGHVVPEIDEVQCFEGHYAPYHGGGSFMGFSEVVPLLEYVNARGIPLRFDGKAKNVCFQIPIPTVRSDFDAAEFKKRCGVVAYNPLASGPGDKSRQGQTRRRIASIYRKAGPVTTIKLLLELANREPTFPGLAYALAVCQVRMGHPYEALKLLGHELASPYPPHPNAAKLQADLIAAFQSQRAEVRPRRPGLTLFAMPRAFVGHVGDIQRNAIESWTRLSPRPEIILFGDEPGIAEIASRLKLRHEPMVKRNDYGTPLVDALFGAAQQLATSDILAYVNADIIFFDDFPAAVANIRGHMPEFLMVGQRTDYTLIGHIDFSCPDWIQQLHQDACINGMLHAETGIDYFIFTPGLWPKIPPFSLGRTAWDNWLLKNVHDQGKAIIDATEAICAIHQSHGYSPKAGGRRGIWKGVEARRNQLLAGSFDDHVLISTASQALGLDGRLTDRPAKTPRCHEPSYPRQRLNWLLQQTKRLLDIHQLDLAQAMLEEAVTLTPDPGEVQPLLDLVVAQRQIK